MGFNSGLKGLNNFTQMQKKNYTCNVNIEERSCNHCCSKNATMYYISWKCICNFVIQHAMRMRQIVICDLPGSTMFPHYLIKGKILVKTLPKVKNVFGFSLQVLSETFLILTRSERDMIQNVHWSSCEVPVILAQCQWHLNRLDRFSKNTHIPTVIKICPVEADFFHTDRRS